MMVELAEVSIDRETDVIVAAVTGEIDLSNADVVKRAIVGAVPNSALGVVIDMSETSYIDSTGVHLLLDLADRARARGQSLLVVAPEGSQVRRVVTIAGAGDALGLSPNADIARRSIVVSDRDGGDGWSTHGGSTNT